MTTLFAIWLTGATLIAWAAWVKQHELPGEIGIKLVLVSMALWPLIIVGVTIDELGTDHGSEDS